MIELCGKCKSAESRWRMTTFINDVTEDNLWLCDACYNEFKSSPIINTLREYAENQYKESRIE